MGFGFAVAFTLLLQLREVQEAIKFTEDHGPSLRLEGLDNLRRESGLVVIALTNPAVRGDEFRLVHAKPASEFVVSGILPVLREELKVYPFGFFRAIRLRRVILCTELRYGVPGSLERAAGLAPARDDAIYLSVGDLSEDTETRFRTRLHHEIFHILDQRAIPGYSNDPEWDGLNAAGFKYVGRQAPSHGLLNDDGTEACPEGFASRYAMTDAGEDKAETFAHLLAVPWSVKKRSQEDVVLRRKAQLLQERFAAWPFLLNKEFWAANDARPLGRFRFRSVVLMLPSLDDCCELRHPQLKALG
jgi:hypothetical protein